MAQPSDGLCMAMCAIAMGSPAGRPCDPPGTATGAEGRTIGGAATGGVTGGITAPLAAVGLIDGVAVLFGRFAPEHAVNRMHIASEMQRFIMISASGWLTLAGR